MTAGERLRVAVLGARGIGRHHARWLASSGCEVTTILGTTPESTLAAAAILRDDFGFAGRTFHRMEDMLRAGGFDAAVVASPAECHLEHAVQLLEHGFHVLCEKPLTWSWERQPAELTADGDRIAATAVASGCVFALNAQYPAILPGLEALYRARHGHLPEWKSLRFRMETRGRARSGHGLAEVWVDLGPHPLAMLDAICPGGVGDGQVIDLSGSQLCLEMRWSGIAGQVAGGIECARIVDGPIRREVECDGFRVRYEGVALDGVFKTRLIPVDPATSEEELGWLGPDLMQVSIQRFVEAARRGVPDQVLVGAAAAARQHRALVDVWSQCRAGWSEAEKPSG